MRWAVEIQKTGLERRNLEDLLAGLGFSIIQGIEYPAITSPEFDDCDNAEIVYEKAKQLHTAFVGPAQIDPDLMLGPVIDYSFDPPKRHFFLSIQSSRHQLSPGKIKISISPPKGVSREELNKWESERAEEEYQAKLEKQRFRLEPVYWNLDAAKILELLSIEKPTAESIYKIYELMEGNPSNRKAFHAKYNISKDDFNRFKDTVHNPMVSGNWARHAVAQPLKSKNPMSISEAQEFVQKIVLDWFKDVRSSRK